MPRPVGRDKDKTWQSQDHDGQIPASSRAAASSTVIPAVCIINKFTLFVA